MARLQGFVGSVVNRVDVEDLGANQYRGKNLFMTQYMRALYGGQVMGQALKAAYLSMSALDSSFLLQSLHCYFVGPLQTSPDVVYKTKHVKVGNNFCTVVVSAIQNSRVGFYCIVSFQREQPGDHEIDYCTKEMPEVPRPQEQRQAVNDSDDSRKGKFKLITVSRDDSDLNVCACVKRNVQVPAKPKTSFWIRSNPSNFVYQSSDHQNLHRISFVYSTDFSIGLPVNAAFPNYRPALTTSLDHSVWFYGNVRDGGWYLHCQELEHSHGGRTLVSARIYNEEGELVAICKQERLTKSKL